MVFVALSCWAQNSTTLQLSNDTIPVNQPEGTVVGRFSLETAPRANTSFPTSMAGELLWMADTKHQVNSAPAIDDDGSVYFGSMDGVLYAVNGYTGENKWQFKTKRVINASPSIGADGNVYVGSWDGYLYCINGKTGKEVWKYPAGSLIDSTPAIDKDGLIYFGTRNGKIYALKVEKVKKRGSGQIVHEARAVWQFRTRGEIRTSPVIGSDGTVFCGSGDKVLYALSGDPEHGEVTVKWEFFTGSALRASPAIGADGTVYVGTSLTAGKVFALEGDYGVKIWEYDIGHPIDGSPILDEKGHLYVSGGREFFAFNGKTGNVLWRKKYGGIVRAPALADDGTLYFGSYQGKIFAVNSQDGSVAWDFASGGGAGPCPAIGRDGIVYIGAESQKLYAFKGTVGPANSGWPMFGGNPRRDGLAQKLFELTPGLGDGDNNLFEIDGYDLKVKIKLDPLRRSFFHIRVRSRTSYGVAVEEPFKIYIKPNAPSDLQLVNQEGEPFNRIKENRPPGSTVAYFRAEDKDGDDTHTFFLPNPQQYPDNAHFQIQGDLLRTTTAPNKIPNYEEKQEYKIFVMVVDSHNLSLGKELTIKVENDNEPPVGIKLDTNSVFGDKKKNWVVGRFSFNDPDFQKQPLDPSVPFELPPSPGELVWEYDLGDPVYSSPAIGVDETLYIGSSRSGLHALNSRDGSLFWVHPSGPIHSSPAVNLDGNVIFGSWQTTSYVHCVKGLNGRGVWETKSGIKVNASPAVTLQGNIVTSSWNGMISSLNDASGGTNWTMGVGSFLESSPAIVQDYVNPNIEKVYFGSYDGYIYALDSVKDPVTQEHSVSVRWRYKTGGTVTSSPAITLDGELFVGSGDKHLYAIDVKDGNALWAFKTQGGVYSSPAVGPDPEKRVYFGSEDGSVYCLEGSNGRKVWETRTGGGVSSSPALSLDGNLYVGSKDGKLHALEAKTGKRLWAYSTGGPITSSPAIGPDGTIYVGSADGKLYAIKGTRGPGKLHWPMFRYNSRRTGMIYPSTFYLVWNAASASYKHLFQVNDDLLTITKDFNQTTRAVDLNGWNSVKIRVKGNYIKGVPLEAEFDIYLKQ